MTDRLIEASEWFAWFVAMPYTLIYVAVFIEHARDKSGTETELGRMFIPTLACWAWILSG